MAKIDTSLMKSWKDQDVMKASDYIRERDMVVTAINDIDTSVTGDYATKIELNDGLLANQNGNHLGTWQGLTPQDISIGLAITPEQIGAARQTDLAAVANSVTQLKSLRYHMSDYPLIAGETDDTPRILRALTAMPVGAELTFPDGTYYTSSGITINDSASLNFEGTAKIMYTGTSSDVFSFKGTTDGTPYVLANTLTRGKKDIQLQRFPVGLNVGDMFVLRDNVISTNRETHEVFAVTMTGTNLVTSPNMNTDANADGVVDGFTSSLGTGATATFTNDATNSAQKINLTASTQSTEATVFQQNLAVTAGQPYSLLVQAKVENPVGSFKGQIAVEYFDAANASLGSTTKDFTNDTFQSIGLHNLIAPTGATKVTIRFKAFATAAGDTGAVYFKTANFLNSTTKVTVRDFVRFSKSATGDLLKIFPIADVRIKNFRYQQVEGATLGSGLNLQYIRNLQISGNFAYRHTDSPIILDTCMDAVVDRVLAADSQSTGLSVVAITRGSSRITVKDSFVNNCGRAVYIGDGFDITVDNITAQNINGVAIYASANGHASDITINNCRLFDVDEGIWIVAGSYADPIASNIVLNNFTITNCMIRLKNINGNGVYSSVFIQGSGLVINNVYVKYLSGSEGSYDTMGCVGINIPSCKMKATIINSTFEGMYEFLFLNNYNSTLVTNDDSNIVIRDVTCRNMRDAIDIKMGQSINLLIYNLICDNLTACVFDNWSGNTQTYSQLVLDGMSLVNSPTTDVWWDVNKIPVPPTSDSIRGYIKNIRTDRVSGVAPAANYNLTYEDVFFTLDGETVYLRGTAVASNTTGKVLPDGIVDGQVIRLVAETGSWVVNKGTNIFFRAAATSITLVQATGSPVVSFVWMTKGTPGWYQIS